MRQDISFSWLPPFSLRWDHTFRQLILDQAFLHPFIVLTNLAFIQCHYSQLEDWGLYGALTLPLPFPKRSHAARCFERCKSLILPKAKFNSYQKKVPDLIYWSAIWDNHRAQISTAAWLLADMVLGSAVVSFTVLNSWSRAIQAMANYTFCFTAFQCKATQLNSAGALVPTEPLQTQGIQSHHVCRGRGPQPLEGKAWRCLMLKQRAPQHSGTMKVNSKILSG